MAWPTTPFFFLACYGPTVHSLVAAWSRASFCVLRIASHRIASPAGLTPWPHPGFTDDGQVCLEGWRGGKGGARGVEERTRTLLPAWLPCPALHCTEWKQRERGKLTLPWMLGESRGKTDEKGEWEWEWEVA
ncbi:uncharacterized protein CCOS01_16111 [Colletotrichum costaricense]|uniref:Uncharacterized protein n=1 Tax=Colletotrichum costaricense TaxID=1209916 RepID=A0AAI9YGL3_9PEZI|nr:uncharacterized protein CCOS01_16111 [Colletotrichum costaricense]KAK1508110.1 hypothetical protein CCOS01_16111 [Colletotrichum costaricense]